MAIKLLKAFLSFFTTQDNVNMLEQLAAKGLNVKGNKAVSQEGKLSGSTFLFTGTLPTLKRSEAEKLAEANGGKLLSSVSSNLNYLVAGESAGSKLDKAKKIKSVKILSEEEFLNLLQS